MVEGGLEPSVAQPPLPLQLFLPLQPLSLDLQPPLPLQLFLPLQECLSGVVAWPTRRTPAALRLFWPAPLVTGWAAAMVPPTRPVRAALSRSALSEFFMVCFLAWGVLAESIRGLVLKQRRLRFASAGKFIRPVGVKLRAKGYNAQEENAQVEQ